MSYLLENIINKSTSIDFDMSKSYSENINNRNLLNHNNSLLPIEPAESSWQESRYGNKTYFEKTYVFQNIKHIEYFLNEYFNAYEKLGYEPELFIKGKKIKIYLGDDSYGDITDTDIEFSKFLDEIYEDIFYINGD